MRSPAGHRTVPLALCVLGCCGITLAPLLRGYVADRLVVAPVNQYSKATLVGENARYLDIAKLTMVEGARVIGTATVRGAPDSSNAETAVWDSFTVVEDAATGADLDARLWRVAFDRRTSELRNCCGAAIGNDPTVRQAGLGMMWPIGNVERRAYPLYDPTTRRPWPALFKGTDEVEGLTAYKYVQHIEPTPVGEYKQLPGKLLGMDEKKSYDADRTYEAWVTVWVDPRTGAPVDRRQQVTSKLRTKDGVDRITVAQMDLRMSDESRRRAVRTADEGAGRIRLVRTTGPLGAFILGGALLGTGVALSTRTRRPGSRRKPTSPSGQAPPPPPLGPTLEPAPPSGPATLSEPGPVIEPMPDA
ncbi:DUF3068 domain-containing protein [Thermomonospora umbrina]|uniref:DUF3068 family protein n=1 Tax=Thermomonospora umbrina TaxID=111806 RepID=A0A3D9T0H7_9ACTN|nr:DUF3068 domain-containing protein [Thermomonospora umbrina]REE97331.1 DUF3068 family protein [Thermomonospora umbrina]